MVASTEETVFPAEGVLSIFEPQGVQGSKLGLRFLSVDQFQQFDESVGLLTLAERGDVQKLTEIAQALGIAIVKP